MNPLHNFDRDASKQEQHTSRDDKKINDGERISISISKRAYDVLVQHTKQLTKENPETQKPFTIEEILDEEILLLFSDDWKQR
jgi:hypothetical protein